MRTVAVVLFWVLSTPVFACSLLNWSAVENSQNILSTVEDNGHFTDQCGLRLSLAGNKSGYVEDLTPGKVFPAVDEYFAQFKLFVDAANFADGDTLEVFSAKDSNNTTIASLALTQQGSRLQPRLEIRDDNGLIQSTVASDLSLGPGWHSIEITWRAANPEQDQAGEILLSLDESPLSCSTAITNIDNATQRMGSIRLGAISGNRASITGEMDFDAFQSSRTGATLADSCETLRYNLPRNQWQQIALPANPESADTVREIFSDDLPELEYGSSWIMFSFNAQTNQYENPGVDGTLEQGIGYWIIQRTEFDVIIDMDSYTEQSAQLSTNLAANGGIGWNMIGVTNTSGAQWDQLQIQTTTGSCAPPAGCSIADAFTHDLFHNQAWHYDGSGYAIIENSDAMPAWTGFWSATLPAAQNLQPRLIQPGL